MTQLYEFSEPNAVILLDGTTVFPLCNYFMEIILTQPYWRSSAEALEQGEELLDQVEAVRAGKSTRYQLSKTTLDATREQMKLVQSNAVTQNPNLVRPALRYGRHVHGAKKQEPKKEAPSDGTEQNATK